MNPIIKAKCSELPPFNSELLKALEFKNVEEVKRIITSPAFVAETSLGVCSSKDIGVNTLLCHATEIGNVEIALLLAECYPEALVMGGRANRTPLHIAVLKGHQELAQRFFAMNPDAYDMEDMLKLTPMDIALSAVPNELLKTNRASIARNLRLEKEKTPPVMFAIDFDGTIAKHHLHNECVKLISCFPPVPNKPKDLYVKLHEKKLIESTGPRIAWKRTFEMMISKGHKITIVSNSSFPELIKLYLCWQLGLSIKMLEKIHVETPDHAKSEDECTPKNALIKKAMRFFDISEDEKNIFLVDDSEDNISKAAKSGYRVLLAHKSGEHLYRLFKLASREPEIAPSSCCAL